VLRFGTDGVRGDAATQLPSEFVVALARAFVRVTGATRVLIARDPRESGARIEADLAAGFAREGASAESLGVLPTPGLAFAARGRNEWSAMISASHNRASDNGVKFFAPGGTKLSDEHQHAIEDELAVLVGDPHVAAEGAVAAITDGSAASRDAYVRWLVAQIAPGALDGLRIVLDTAHGAASSVAPAVFTALGADVVVLHDAPDGRNINADCGSTHPQVLQRAVVEHGAALGLAFDGDADRCLAVDGHGALVDGDQIMAVLALDLRARGALQPPAIAVTVMSNLGLRQALAREGIDIVETPVGDRHVVAAMQRDGIQLGGEQSGHVIVASRALTGDGVLTGLLLADVVARSGRSLADLAGVMTRLPQVLHNVAVAAPGAADRPEVDAVIAAVAAELGDRGRVLVRPSGTEPVVRVMVEAPTAAEADAAAERIAAVLAT
jgi:phosphoglucosamine mutase